MPSRSDLDFSKSLQQLDGRDWGEPTYPSYLVVECHRLRRVPLSELDGGNLRMLIGQEIGLVYLVPKAIEMLAGDPLLEASYGLYPGDLLCCLLMLPRDFWQQHQEWRARLRTISIAARSRCDELAASSEADWRVMPVEPSVIKALDRFLAARP